MSTTFELANSTIVDSNRGLSRRVESVDQKPGSAFPPMKIAMIGVKGVPHPGGIENVVEELGSRLVQKGHQVTVYVRPHYSPPSRTEFRGMRLIHLPSVPTKHLDALTHTLAATAHAMFSDFDIAHVHSIGLSPFAMPLRLRGTKTIVQSHGLDWQRQKWGPLARAYLRASDWGTVFFPDLTTVVSQKMKHYYEDRFRKEVAYVPNGVGGAIRVPSQRIKELGLQGDDYILFASRLVREKGLHYLLDAYRGLRNPGKKLVIAGDSNYGDQYATSLKEQASENILFLGFARGRLFDELLSWAHIYVLPSDIEGLSTGLLQAMSYGNCVLVSNIEENLEVIGQSGMSFESGNVADLKQKLELLLSSHDLVNQYRRGASAHVLRKYSWDSVADEYERLYSRLLQQKTA